MKKDTFNIDIRFYGVSAFVLAILGQTLLCGLVVAAAIFLSRDEWASRQAIQAMCIALLSNVISAVFAVFTIFNAIPLVGGAITAFFQSISGFFQLIPFVFAIIGLVKTVKGNEANIPLFAKWARKAYGVTEQKVYVSSDSANGQ